MRIRKAFAPTAVALLLAGASTPAWGESKANSASHVDPIEGSSLHRVTLSERAAERLGIMTEVVGGQEISRSFRILGAAMVPPYPEALMSHLEGDGQMPAIVIRAARTMEASSLAPGHLASVRLTGRSGDTGSLDARLIAILAADTPDTADEMFFMVDPAAQVLAPQQQVLVEFTTTEPQSRAVQSAAVVYDEGGETWVFVSPEPLVYMRHKVDVDFVHQDWAVLTDGPPDGTLVVTGGAMLLLGTEFGIGH